MTQRLPTPGGDNGTWGDVLNSFLEVSHDTDGTLSSNTVGTNQLQAGSVGTSQIANNAVTNTLLDSPTQTAINAIAGKYTLPSGGIPKTDLATSVQTSLSSADTALQTSQLGTASGIAQLDGSSTLKASQIPSSVVTSSRSGLVVPGWMNEGNGPIFTADGHNLTAPYAPSSDTSFAPDTHWADYDHYLAYAIGRIQYIYAPWTTSGWAARIEVHNGDRGSGDSSSIDRCEHTAVGVYSSGASGAQGWGNGTDMWWGISLMLDPVTFANGLPTKSSSPIWLLCHQFFAQNFLNGTAGTSGGSPPFDIELNSSAGFQITMRAGIIANSTTAAPINYSWNVGSIPAELGVPHDFLIRYRYSTGTDGQLQVYHKVRGQQFPSVPQVNLYAGQNISAPTDGSNAGGVSAGPNIATGVTAITCNSPNSGEVISYYPETGTYRQTPDASPGRTVVYHGGLTGRLSRQEAEAAAPWAGASNANTNSDDGLHWTFGQPFMPSNGSTAPGQYRIEGVRLSIKKTGTLSQFSFWVATSSGNVIMQIFDAGDSAYGTTLTALWTGGSEAVSSANGWQSAWSPNLKVYSGQQLYATLMFDNATAAYGCSQSLGAVATLPPGFLPSAANSLIGFDVGNGNFTPPSSLSVSAGQNQGHPPLIIAQVI